MRFILAGFLILAGTLARGDTLDRLVVASAVADVVTTELALRQPGTYEVNPLMQSPAARVGVKAAATIGAIAAARAFERRGHRGWSRGVRIACIVMWSGAAVNSVVKLKKGDR